MRKRAAVRAKQDVVLAWAIAVELERLGGLDRAFIKEHVLGFDEFMEAAHAYTSERAADICGVKLDDIQTFARWYNPRTREVSLFVAPGASGSRSITAVFADDASKLAQTI